MNRAASASGRLKSSSTAPPPRTFTRTGTATITAPSASGGAVPTGRIEMLLWLEGLCGRQIETIEGLREGVSYVMVLCDIISQSGDPAVASRGEMAFDILDHKVDARIQLAATPALDSIQVTEACERNLQAAQTIIRSCVPKRFGIEMDVPKMAKGNMQDHMHFLRWLVQLPKKVPRGDAHHAQQHQPIVNRAAPAAAASTPNNQSASARRPSGTASTNGPSADPTIISTLIALQKEVVTLEAKAVAGNGGGAEAPALTFADVQARTEQRDALASTLEQIAELVLHSGEKARRDRQPACPLQLELQKVFYPRK